MREQGTLFVVLEAHARCATLYLRGPLDAAAVERAVALCGALPPAVRALRVDARHLPVHDPWTHTALRGIVAAWRSTRDDADDLGEAPAAVTISLQGCGIGETGSRQLPGALEDSRAALAQAAPVPSHTPAHTCAN